MTRRPHSFARRALLLGRLCGRVGVCRRLLLVVVSVVWLPLLLLRTVSFAHSVMSVCALPLSVEAHAPTQSCPRRSRSRSLFLFLSPFAKRLISRPYRSLFSFAHTHTTRHRWCGRLERVVSPLSLPPRTPARPREMRARSSADQPGPPPSSHVLRLTNAPQRRHSENEPTEGCPWPMSFRPRCFTAPQAPAPLAHRSLSADLRTQTARRARASRIKQPPGQLCGM